MQNQLAKKGALNCKSSFSFVFAFDGDVIVVAAAASSTSPPLPSALYKPRKSCVVVVIDAAATPDELCCGENDIGIAPAGTEATLWRGSGS